jgi:hypothetical protein
MEEELVVMLKIKREGKGCIALYVTTNAGGWGGGG